MTGARDCLAALAASAGALVVSATVVRQRPWASALFVGERLRVMMASDDDDALDAWLATLPDADLPLRHGFVANVEVVERSANRAALDILLIDS